MALFSLLGISSPRVDVLVYIGMVAIVRLSFTLPTSQVVRPEMALPLLDNLHLTLSNEWSRGPRSENQALQLVAMTKIVRLVGSTAGKV